VFFVLWLWISPTDNAKRFAGRRLDAKLFPFLMGTLWEKEPGIEITEFREMTSCKQAWDDWLQSPSHYAKEDPVMMEAGVGKYFNSIQMVGRKR
jgi:hypothetical protein